MLDPVAELGEDRVGHVERVLGHEIDADPLAAHEAHDELDPLEQHLRCLVEEQVRLVEEEEDELGLVEVTDFGQMLVQLRQHPEQKGRIQARARQQLVGCQD